MNTEQLISEAIKLLESSNSQTREHGVETLGRLRASRVTALLSNCLLDQDDRVREWTAWALGQIEGPETAGNRIDNLHSLFGDRSISITEVHHLKCIALGLEPPPPSYEPPEPPVRVVPAPL